MTSEVAVMNRLGVAIAADSAVTIGSSGNSKTYYTQQKLFNLSKNHFVGIMIYHNLRYMDINWEIIINEFGKDLGDKSLPNLEEYAEKFLDFLRDFKYVDAFQKEFLEEMSNLFFDEIKEDYKKDISENYKDQEITKAQQGKILAGILKKTREKLKNTENYVSFTDDGFINENKAIIAKEMEETFSDFSINDKMKEELMDLFLLDISKIEIGAWLDYSTGIVFAGYGDKEIFPSTVEFQLLGKLGKNILHSEIMPDNDSFSHINPYSQPNVINSFIRGMDPAFRRMIDGELDKIVEKVADIAGKKHIEEVGLLIKELKDKIQSFQELEYRDPVLEIVRSLPKSDLAEMAEALVNITALRQHVSTEQETVGGPTDVALITKTDGFVWIKKKQLFHSIQDNGA